MDLRVLAIEEEGIGSNTLERRKVARKLGFEVYRPDVPVLVAPGVLPYKKISTEKLNAVSITTMMTVCCVFGGL